MKLWKHAFTCIALFSACIMVSAYAAEEKTVTNINELQSEIENAVEDTTLYLSEDFVSGRASLSVPATDVSIIIDGGNILWDNGSIQVQGAGGGPLP